MLFSVPAGRNITPVEHGVIDDLHPVAAIRQGKQAIGYLTAGAILLHMIPIAQRILVLDLGAFPYR